MTSFEDRYLDVLQNIEAVIVRVFGGHAACSTRKSSKPLEGSGPNTAIVYGIAPLAILSRDTCHL